MAKTAKRRRSQRIKKSQRRTTIHPTRSVAGQLRKRRARKWQKHYK